MRHVIAALLLLTASAAHAGPKPPPVNIKDARAVWADDVNTCQRYTMANFVPAPVVEDQPAGQVCEVLGGVVRCHNVGSSGGWAAGYTQTRKALGGDAQDRAKMYYGCLNELGWRQPAE
jgi:hypothetical protein